MGTRDVSQCFECGVVGEGEVDIDNGLFVWKRERSGHDRVCAGHAGR
jgi:hypothetical protein